MLDYTGPETFNAQLKISLIHLEAMFGKLFSKRFNALTLPSLATAITFSFNQKSEASGLHQSPAIDHSNVVLLSGTANLALSQQISDLLQTPLLDVTTKRFSDGEINCVINESIRGKDVFIIQTCAAPVNDNVMELLLTVAAARRAGANTVTTVIHILDTNTTDGTILSTVWATLHSDDFSKIDALPCCGPTDSFN